MISDVTRHCVHGDGQTLNIPHRAHAVIYCRNDGKGVANVIFLL